MEKKRNQVSFVEAGEEKWPASVLGGTTASLRSLDDLPSPGKFDNASNVSYAASLEFHGSSDGEEKEGESDEAPTPRPVPLNFVDRDEFINDNKFFNPKGLDLSRRPPRGDPDDPWSIAMREALRLGEFNLSSLPGVDWRRKTKENPRGITTADMYMEEQGHELRAVDTLNAVRITRIGECSAVDLLTVMTK